MFLVVFVVACLWLCVCGYVFVVVCVWLCWWLCVCGCVGSYVFVIVCLWLCVCDCGCVLWLRSGREHLGLELAVEVRQGTLGADGCG